MTVCAGCNDEIRMLYLLLFRALKPLQSKFLLLMDHMTNGRQNPPQKISHSLISQSLIIVISAKKAQISLTRHLRSQHDGLGQRLHVAGLLATQPLALQLSRYACKQSLHHHACPFSEGNPVSVSSLCQQYGCDMVEIILMLIKTFSDQICRRMYVNVHANITYHICEALRIWTTEICCYNLSSPMMHCTFLCRKNKKDSAEVSSFVIQRRNPKLILVINPKPHAVFGHINL